MSVLLLRQGRGAFESCNRLTAVEDFLVKYTRNGVLARMGRGG